MKLADKKAEIEKEFDKWFNHGTKEEPRFAYTSLAYLEVRKFIEDSLDEYAKEVREETGKELREGDKVEIVTPNRRAYFLPENRVKGVISTIRNGKYNLTLTIDTSSSGEEQEKE